MPSLYAPDFRRRNYNDPDPAAIQARQLRQQLADQRRARSTPSEMQGMNAADQLKHINDVQNLRASDPSNASLARRDLNDIWAANMPSVREQLQQRQASIAPPADAATPAPARLRAGVQPQPDAAPAIASPATPAPRLRAGVLPQPEPAVVQASPQQTVTTQAGPAPAPASNPNLVIGQRPDLSGPGWSDEAGRRAARTIDATGGTNGLEPETAAATARNIQQHIDADAAQQARTAQQVEDFKNNSPEMRDLQGRQRTVENRLNALGDFDTAAAASPGGVYAGGIRAYQRDLVAKQAGDQIRQREAAAGQQQRQFETQIADDHTQRLQRLADNPPVAPDRHVYAMTPEDRQATADRVRFARESAQARAAAPLERERLQQRMLAAQAQLTEAQARSAGQPQPPSARDRAYDARAERDRAEADRLRQPLPVDPSRVAAHLSRSPGLFPPKDKLGDGTNLLSKNPLVAKQIYEQVKQMYPDLDGRTLERLSRDAALHMGWNVEKG